MQNWRMNGSATHSEQKSRSARMSASLKSREWLLWGCEGACELHEDFGETAGRAERGIARGMRRDRGHQERLRGSNTKQ
eukprot:3929560-Pleurochrysis_carterae.AAC.1